MLYTGSTPHRSNHITSAPQQARKGYQMPVDADPIEDNAVPAGLSKYAASRPRRRIVVMSQNGATIEAEAQNDSVSYECHRPDGSLAWALDLTYTPKEKPQG